MTALENIVISISSLLLLALISTACTNGLEPTATSTLEPSGSPEPTSTPKAQAVSIAGPACPDSFQENQTASISKDVQISANHLLTLTLGSTPSIPCGWHAPEISDQTVVHQVEHHSDWPAEGATPMPGAPGTETWVFETLTEGESQIILQCVCLNEEGSEEEISGTFVLNVTVNE